VGDKQPGAPSIRAFGEWVGDQQPPRRVPHPFAPLANGWETSSRLAGCPIHSRLWRMGGRPAAASRAHIGLRRTAGAWQPSRRMIYPQRRYEIRTLPLCVCSGPGMRHIRVFAIHNPTLFPGQTRPRFA
jgi:hypothetical protein